jgi:hypothetical protein
MWWVERLVVCVWRVVCGVCVVSAVGVRDTLAVSWNSAGSGTGTVAYRYVCGACLHPLASTYTLSLMTTT